MKNKLILLVLCILTYVACKKIELILPTSFIIFYNAMLIYFLIADWRRKEKGTVALISFGLITLNGFIGFIILFRQPVLMPLITQFGSTLLLGVLMGVSLLNVFPLMTVSHFLTDKVITLDMLNVLFDPDIRKAYWAKRKKQFLSLFTSSS